eukprot:56652-Eustigmatos_ZCMA.PRE.1
MRWHNGVVSAADRLRLCSRSLPQLMHDSQSVVRRAGFRGNGALNSRSLSASVGAAVIAAVPAAAPPPDAAPAAGVA